MLKLLCGPPASGKSTYRENLDKEYTNVIVLSSDELRGIIGKNPEDQSVSHIVFKTMQTMTEYFLRKGKVVVIDATNVSIKARKDFIDIARKVGVKVEAVVFNITAEEAKRRNAARDRKVPEDVIDRMFANFVIPVVGEVDSVVYANARLHKE